MPLEVRFTRSGSSILYRNNPAFLAGIYPPKRDDCENTDATCGSAIDCGIEALDLADPAMNQAMDRLQSRRNNFFRFPLLPYWHYGKPGDVYSPYRREANGLWKLDSFNGSYKDRLRRMIEIAAAHKIAVQLTLFDTPGLEAGADRWNKNPWNNANNTSPFITAQTDGLPEFYQIEQNAQMKQRQEDYLQWVVGWTKDYWNVFYEIMNEPGGDLAARVAWANWVTGIIDGATLSQRLVFYNMHPYTANDMNYWYDNRATLTNYGKLDGVIFHATGINPDDARFAKFRDKIFQVSSDAGPIPQRCRAAWNQGTTTHAFTNGMMFQAETLSLRAADGIGGANPRPTDLS
jgi:hypothetical protein